MPWTRTVTQYLHVVESSPIIAEALQLLQDNLVWIVTCSLEVLNRQVFNLLLTF